MCVVGSLNCTEWSLLPPATEEMAIQTSVVSGRFMGDPSHEYEHTELQKVNEGEKAFDEEVVVSSGLWGGKCRCVYVCKCRAGGVVSAEVGVCAVGGVCWKGLNKCQSWPRVNGRMCEDHRQKPSVLQPHKPNTNQHKNRECCSRESWRDAQRLRALAALSEVLGSIPSTHMGAYNCL